MKTINRFRRLLLWMYVRDQRIRRVPDEVHDESFWVRWNKIHRQNEKLLKQIIKMIGWPTVSKVGPWASRAAWLVVQHADKDTAFQRECLELMSHENSQNVSEIDIAYLYDRICVNEGRPQFFGTQFITNHYGAYGPQPIFDLVSVDERRRVVGLEPLAEYKRRLEMKYGN